MQVQVNPILYVSTCVSWFSLLTELQKSLIYKSSSPGEMTRAIESSECPLGMEISFGSPRSLSLSGSELWGGVLISTFLRCLTTAVFMVTGLEGF